MPSKDRQRELARKKLERHMARRAAAAKRRRQIFAGVGASATLILLVAVVVIVVLNRDDDGKSSKAVDPTCVYLDAGKDPAHIKDVGRPPTSGVADSGLLNVQLNTNFGALNVQLDQGAAPCTVNSFHHLLQKAFFDNTKCHRLVTSGIKVLQCGDPFADGRGGPSYQFGTENVPTNDQPPYPVGSIAMAHGQDDPNSNSSQFFIVWGDSPNLTADYSLIGKVTGGMDIITDKIVPNGLKDEEEPGSGDGAPAKDVVIEKAQLV